MKRNGNTKKKNESYKFVVMGNFTPYTERSLGMTMFPLKICEVKHEIYIPGPRYKKCSVISVTSWDQAQNLKKKLEFFSYF